MIFNAEHRSFAADRNQNTACQNPGFWLNAETGKVVSPPSLYGRLIDRQIVLLGETHDNGDHHRWQLNTIAALHSRVDRLVLGVEMLPRRYQTILDQWVRGELTQQAFLEAVNWQQTWGYDPDLYMPIFHFARMHRIQIIALNVDRQLVAKVGTDGWESVPVNEREGLTSPAPALPDYVRSLAEVYASKLRLRRSRGEATPDQDTDENPKPPPDLEQIMSRPDFNRFVEAQLTWDRAMAEGIKSAKTGDRNAMVVAIMGSGHLANFHGVPHQLEDLGLGGSAVLLPIEITRACERTFDGYADYLFSVDSSKLAGENPPKMRLGISITEANHGVRVTEVQPNSVAATSRLRQGDLVVAAAGIKISETSELLKVLSRQAPGTWLPLVVERDGVEIEVIAKFPQQQE